MGSLAHRIREWRQKRGWSLQRLAEACGTTKSQIDKLERGSRRLTVDWMVRVARALGEDPRELVPGDPLPGAAAGPEGAVPAFLPIRGVRRGARPGCFFLAAKPADHTLRPPFLAHAREAYAFFAPDDAVAPMYRARQLLFVHPHREPAPGGGAVVLLRTGEAWLGALQKRARQGLVVRRFNATPRDLRVTEAEIAAVHAIVAAMEPG